MHTAIYVIVLFPFFFTYWSLWVFFNNVYKPFISRGMEYRYVCFYSLVVDIWFVWTFFFLLFLEELHSIMSHRVLIFLIEFDIPYRGAKMLKIMLYGQIFLLLIIGFRQSKSLSGRKKFIRSSSMDFLLLHFVLSVPYMLQFVKKNQKTK